MATPSSSYFVGSNDDIFLKFSYGCIFFFCCYCLVTLRTIFTKIMRSPKPSVIIPAYSSSSSTSNDDLVKYDVFLSFRGCDTRFGFTNNLKEALCHKGIEVFLDEEGLLGGDDISPILLQRIQESNISVVIFSKNYADSPWCLDELVKIHECMQTQNIAVLPIFYGVDPTHVQELEGDFGKAFIKLQRKFDLGKVERWKDALSQLSNLKGWDSHNFRSESELIKNIVKDILDKLKHASMPLNDFSGLVGMESRVEEVLSLVTSGSSSSMRIVGIWGMGGIGKTTIAEVAFKAVSTQFDGACFLRNVKEMYEKPTTLANELLSQLLEIPNLNVGTPKLLPSGFLSRLERRKVLIVLDDVNGFLQLEQVIGDNNNLFGPGSRVVVTSRDRQVLECRCDAIYEVMKLDNEHSLQLFKSHAFRENGIINMDPSFLGLSWEVVKYADGNPLALKVLGCDMFKKDKEDWESAIRKLRKFPHKEIQNILKLSYDGLEWHEQQLLLDIACVFRGWSVHDIEAILDAKHGIGRLRDKSLITVGYKEGRIEMHDLIQQMCKDIVLEENRWDPRKRSRLWHYEDILQVLNKPKGAKRIEALSLEMSQISHFQLSSKAFEEMHNLRLLHFYYDCSWKNNSIKLELLQGLEYLPNSLKLLHWDLYPSLSFPLNFRPESLVHLKMRNSSLTQLWNGDNVRLVNLKVCDLVGSKELNRIMDFSAVPNLEVLNLWCCSNLVEISSSIQYCRKLTTMDISWCVNLSVPSDLSLTSLEEVCLRGCSRITEFPKLPPTVKLINFEESGVKQVPGSSIGHLSQLEVLHLREISKTLPSEIGNLNCLEVLCFLGGQDITSLPSAICNLSRLVRLHCSCKNLESLPNEIGWLERLEILYLSGCCKMTSLPHSICHLKSLERLSLKGCANLKGLPELLSPLVSLKELDLSGTNIEYIGSEVIKQLSKLEWLYLRDCKRLRCIQHLPASLTVLDATNCSSLTSVASMVETNIGYCDLMFENCFILDHSFIRSVIESRILTNHLHMKFWIPGYEIPEWFDYKSSIINDNNNVGGSSSSMIIVVPRLLHHHHHRRRILRSWNFGHVIAPPFPDRCIRYDWHCYVLEETGICVHIKETVVLDILDPKAEHVCFRNVPNRDVTCLKHPPIWARFEIPIIPGVQVIQAGIHLTFDNDDDDDDDDDIEKKEEQGEGVGVRVGEGEEVGKEPKTEKTSLYMPEHEFEAIVNYMKQNNIRELDTNNFTHLKDWSSFPW